MISTLDVLGQLRKTSVEVNDLSDKGSPLKIDSKVVFLDEIVADNQELRTRYSLDGRVTNAASLEVLAFEVQLDMFSDRGGGGHLNYDVDFFFKQEGIAPGSEVPVKENATGWEIVPYHADVSARAARAEGRVIYAEFADGSTFGHSDWGSSLHAGRIGTMDRMKALVQIYEDGDSSAFSKSIRGAVANQEMSEYTRQMLADLAGILVTRGVDAVAAEIRTRLACAQRHMNAMKST
ncbi:MAG: hypothetical protein WA734_13035 [Candidatus Acidiferrales bacterium]